MADAERGLPSKSCQNEGSSRSLMTETKRIAKLVCDWGEKSTGAEERNLRDFLILAGTNLEVRDLNTPMPTSSLEGGQA